MPIDDTPPLVASFHLDPLATDPNAVIRVNTDVNGDQALGGSSQANWLSPDGGYAYFRSTAANLVAGDTANEDSFRKNLVTGEIVKVTTPVAGQITREAGGQAVQSQNGQFVVFATQTGLASNDGNLRDDVYIVNTSTGIVTPVSLRPNGGANGTFPTMTDSVFVRPTGSAQPDVSADGRYVVFSSVMTDLAGTSGQDQNQSLDIFLRDTMAPHSSGVQRISVNAAGQEATGPFSGFASSFAPAISADGRYVVFWSFANNLVPGDANNQVDIFRKDLLTGLVQLVSTSATGVQSNDFSTRPDISADGRYVTFTSYASNLVPGDTNGLGDIFRKDMVTGEIIRVSTSATGAQASSDEGTFVSNDGRYVLYTSDATNLVSGDTNGQKDVFRVDVESLRDNQAIAGNRRLSLDLQTDDATQVTVQWGDGVVTTAAGGPAWTLAHSYGANGTFNAVVTLTDAADNISSTAYTITLASPQIALTAATAGSAGRDIVLGSSVDDVIETGAAGDEIAAGDGNDTIKGGEGDDAISGGAGTDTIVLSGNRSDYSISNIGAVFVIGDQRSGVNEGIDTLRDVEFVTFTDGTFGLAALANVAPSGTVTITGSAIEDQVLTASNDLTDADGLGPIGYQWQRNSGSGFADIASATGSTYTLDDADVGATIRVVAGYTDGHGTAESVASAASGTVANINDAPAAVTLVNMTAALAENTSTAARIKVADIVVTDDGLGSNDLGLTGADAVFFEIIGTSLYLRAGTVLDFEGKASYAVAVTADDPTVGAGIDATSATYTLAVTNVAEAPAALSPVIKLGPEILVNTTTFRDQTNPVVAKLNDGFVIVWEDRSTEQPDGTGRGIRAQRFDQDNHKVGSEILVTTGFPNFELAPSVTRLANGGFVVTWADRDLDLPADTSGTALKGRFFDALGAPVGTEFVINTSTESDQVYPASAALTNGNFVVTWHDHASYLGNGGPDSSSFSVKAQIFDSGGGRLGGELTVNTTYFQAQMFPTVDATANGGFAIVWRDASNQGGDSSDTSIKARTFDAAGNGLTTEFLVNSFTFNSQEQPSITVLANGNLAITWMDVEGSGGDGSSTGIKGKIVSPTGATIVAEFLVNTATQFSQADPHVAAFADGGFVIVWTDGSGDAVDFSVKGQVYNSAGQRVGGEFHAETSVIEKQEFSSIAALTGGQFVVTWRDWSGLGGNSSERSVKAQILTVNRAPTDISLSINAVAENSAPGTAVGVLTATDPDSGETFVFSLVDNAGGRFALNGSTVIVAGALDHEAASSHQIVVRVRDSFHNTFDKGLTIGVADVNEAPTGAVTISGSTTEDQVLTASNTLADDDGLGVVGYQWQRNTGRASPCRRRDRRDLHAGRCGCRRDDPRRRQLHRRTWHSGERGERRYRRGGQCQRRAERHGDDRRHRDRGSDP